MDVFTGGLANSPSENPLNYGTDSTHTIDSTRPFTVRHDFTEDNGGLLSGHVTTLTQDSATLTLDSAACTDTSALSGMTDDMKNMVLVISNWEQ